MPWNTPYWQPAGEPWLPSRWPPYDWQIVTAEYGLNPPIPEGAIVPWWLQPKDTWPFDQIPWEPKIFGAFSARKVTMWPEDLSGIPPFGTVKVKTLDYPKFGSHQLASIKVHMPPKPLLEINPHYSLWDEGKLLEAMRIIDVKRGRLG